MSRYRVIEHNRKDNDTDNWWWEKLSGYHGQIEFPINHKDDSAIAYATQVTNVNARQHMATRLISTISSLSDVFQRLSHVPDLVVQSVLTSVNLNNDRTYTHLRTTFILSSLQSDVLSLSFDSLAWMNHSFSGFDIVDIKHAGHDKSSSLIEVVVVVEQTIRPDPDVVSHFVTDAHQLNQRTYSCAVLFIKEK